MLQMSNSQVFAFVEGGLDRNFYDRLLEKRCENDLHYEVYAAKELPGATGGKKPLISFHETLRKNQRLENVWFGKKYICLFFVDKDIDEVTGDLVESAHFLYTDTYDLEGHLLSCGDLSRAIADAAHLTYKQSSAAIGNSKRFIIDQTEDWGDWLVVCILSQIYKVNFGCSYERALPVDKKKEFTLDHQDSKLKIIQQRIIDEVGISSQAYQNKYEEIKRMVEDEKGNGNILKYFKGKWFKPIFQKFAKDSLNIDDANTDGLFENVLRTLVCQIAADKGCACCRSALGKIDGMIEGVKG